MICGSLCLFFCNLSLTIVLSGFLRITASALTMSYLHLFLFSDFDVSSMVTLKIKLSSKPASGHDSTKIMGVKQDFVFPNDERFIRHACKQYSGLPCGPQTLYGRLKQTMSLFFFFFFGRNAIRFA